MMLIGRLTKNAVVNQLKDEWQVVNFSLTINAYTGLDREAKAYLKCHVNSITVHQHIKGNRATTKAPKEEVTDDLPF